MKAKLPTVILPAVLVSTVLAQEPAGERPGGGPGGPPRVLQRLPDSLGLDDEQRVRFDEVMAAHRERVQELRDLGREMRRARRDGDEQRAAELEAQLADRTANVRGVLDHTFDQIEPILDDEQLSRFSEIRQEVRQRFERRQEGRGWGGFGRRGPGGMLRRMADTLELDEDQRAEFDEIMDAHRERMGSARELGRAMRDARREGDTKKADELRAQMLESGVDPWESMRQAMDEVEPILTDEQFERFSEMRTNMQQRRERRGRVRRWATELPDALSMTESQRQEFNEYLRSRRDGWREYAQRMRDIYRQMDEAREAGDAERLEALQAELEAARPDPETMEAEFAEAVRGILSDDQLPLLDAYFAGSTAGRDELPDDVRSLIRAAARSGLDRAQRKAWRVIMRDAVKALRSVDRKDEEAVAKLTAETRSQIVGMLREDQLERFEKQLDRLKRARTHKSTASSRGHRP